MIKKASFKIRTKPFGVDFIGNKLIEDRQLAISSELSRSEKVWRRFVCSEPADLCVKKRVHLSI